MKRYRFICLAAAFTLSMAEPSFARGQRTCSGESETLDCLKENFEEIYESQYIKFLIIIGKAQIEALKCDSSGTTTAYLDIAPKIGNNLEVKEAFKDVIETKFLVSAPDCFMNAMLKAGDDSKEIIFGNYLRKPAFIKKEEVEGILSRYKEQNRYKDMLERYYYKK